MDSQTDVAFTNQLVKNANVSGVRWGTALLRTQQWAFGQSGSTYFADLGRTEQLFGDPAMKVFGSAGGGVSPGGTSGGGTNNPTRPSAPKSTPTPAPTLTPSAPSTSTPAAPGTF
jgi:hypothetical protein